MGTEDESKELEYAIEPSDTPDNASTALKDTLVTWSVLRTSGVAVSPAISGRVASSRNETASVVEAPVASVTVHDRT